MPNKQQAIYTLPSTQEVGVFLDSVSSDISTGLKGQDVLDSVKNEAGTKMKLPKRLEAMLAQAPEAEHARVLDSVIVGVREFEASHGRKPTADVVDAAIQQGHAALIHVLDSATSAHHDQISLQPNRAVVAIVSAIAEAIPFAGYLPVDIGSNEGKLAILSHQAGSAFGDYTLGELMDGTNVGDVYASSQRMVEIDTSGAAPYNSKFSVANLVANPGFCDPAATGVGVLRGRSVVYVGGLPIALDTANGSAANSPFTGSVTIGSTVHTLTGYVTVASGAVQITTVTPALPAGYQKVVVQGFIDYETQPSLIPLVGIKAEVFPVFANAHRIATKLSIDASGQIRNELGLDAESEALMALRTQLAMERHYQALRYVRMLSIHNSATHDLDYDGRSLQMNRSQMWLDAQAPLGELDQQMANKTMDYGIQFVYASSFLINQWMSCGRDIFEPSGVANRPGIFRAGRLFGKYEVYYSPKVVNQAADLSTAEMLLIGRSSQVARCPILLGDAVAPTLVEIGTQLDLNKQLAMYARNFTAVNPHEASAKGCGLLNVTGLK